MAWVEGRIVFRHPAQISSHTSTEAVRGAIGSLENVPGERLILWAAMTAFVKSDRNITALLAPPLTIKVYPLTDLLG